MVVSRRAFLCGGALATTSGLLIGGAMSERSLIAGGRAAQRPLFVSTWAFGKPVNDRALKVAQDGGSTLDAIEQGIWIAEEDASNASVGLGGSPNAAGVVQLDACIMWGPGHRAGCVAALEGILHPISVARRVMERTPHVMLAGDGARRFALEQGFPTVDLLTEQRRREWEEWKAKPATTRKQDPADNHDTITLLALDRDGNLGGGCSTSGLAYKLPGRIGDSPILGSGLYVDNEVGAAGATGIGENIMRYCGSLLVVEYMRQGASPEEACLATIRRIVQHEQRGAARPSTPQRPGEIAGTAKNSDLSIHFIALDKQGRFGAAGTSESFPYSVATTDRSEVLAGARFQS